MGFPMEEQARKKMSVTVEYDQLQKGEVVGRSTKTFPTMQKAKSFYTSAYRDGLHPKVTHANP